MSNIKWIKLSTSMFEDEKIKLIESLPESDTILIIWIKLLSLAGKTNATGGVYLNENIPYTDEMLSTIFGRPLQTVRLALTTFEKYGMIEITDHKFIFISNWEKHQNIDGMEKIRLQTAERVRKHREKKQKEQLELEGECSNKDVTLHVTHGNATEEEKELEEDKEKDLKKYIVEIVTYLNDVCSTSYRLSAKKTQSLIKARLKEGFTIDDFKTVIDIKAKEWIRTDQAKYLRPETLFGTKFEGYLQQGKVVNSRGASQGNRYSSIAIEEDDLPF